TPNQLCPGYLRDGLSTVSCDSRVWHQNRRTLPGRGAPRTAEVSPPQSNSLHRRVFWRRNKYFRRRKKPWLKQSKKSVPTPTVAVLFPREKSIAVRRARMPPKARGQPTVAPVRIRSAKVQWQHSLGSVLAGLQAPRQSC